jgi:glyoxalase family protein
MRFGEPSLPFRDPHGTFLALTETTEHDKQAFVPWSDSVVPADLQIRALGSVRLTVHDDDATTRFLSGSYGFERGTTEDEWTRYVVGDGMGAQRIDIREMPDASRGAVGVGSIHHVAFRVTDEPAQLSVRSQIVASGGRPTDVIDRFWFKSVYVREPAGALCEVATDGPGFGVDESDEHLGEGLVLPPWYEERRREIENGLPELDYRPEEWARADAVAQDGAVAARDVPAPVGAADPEHR